MYNCILCLKTVGRSKLPYYGYVKAIIINLYMKKQPIDILRIIDWVAFVLELNVENLISKSRNRKHYDGRIIAINISRKRNGKKIRYKKYAEIFKRNNHSFAVYGFYQCEKLIKSDKEFKDKYEIANDFVTLEINKL